MRPILIGIFSAFFFAFTFVLNASMEAAGELLFLSILFPSPTSWLGIGVVILGMIFHSYVSSVKTEKYEKHLV